MYSYSTQGTCSRTIHVALDGDRITHVDFIGGCNGNLKAIPKLVTGMTIDRVAELLEGNTCNNRPTSCADQLVKALREAQAHGEGQTK
ncbi:MAG: TIGR03905 family TSCPD domain-containing protein [Eggerthellaceae bacterium]|jgi:uncharacterized protein (TIGR03905 family)|nr:TIGR03905 family TSCPD domain-containing protein [Eggerthellaceae bacterium]MCH4221125.1 TIGR03905 family TSCPD domain-containing protein [Eggerthellaceae bacterium]